MICEKCNEKKATIHLTEVINGKKRELHLCEECANKRKDINFSIDFDMPFSMKDIFTSIMDMGINKEIPKVEELVCSECKSSYRSFKDVGRLGCFKCYETFMNQLEPLIKRIQGANKHLGKVPKRIAGPIKIKNEIKNLRLELNEAIEKEEFEKAAKLRDKIKELQNEV